MTVLGAGSATAATMDSQPSFEFPLGGTSYGVLDLRGGDGQVNVVSLDASADYAAIRVRDDGAPLTPAGQCAPNDEHAVTCEGRNEDGMTRPLRLQLGDGDDQYTATGAPVDQIIIDGGTGDDVLRTGAGSFTVANLLLPGLITGGPGADRIEAGAGDDIVYEQDANGAGADDLSGGDGHDELVYGTRPNGVSVTLDGKANDGEPGEHDNVRSDFEFVEATDHADHIELTARGGANGRAGDDTIVATRSRLIGQLSCGEGDDTVIIDSPRSSPPAIAIGQSADCEHVKFICDVPRLKAKSRRAAKRALARNHCRVRRIRGSATGQVVSQKPRAGKRLGVGGRVSFTLRTAAPRHKQPAPAPRR